MLHARQDYNNRVQDSANIIPADEPVFLLRGQDKYAPALLLEYYKYIVDKDEDMAITVLKHAHAMIDWQMNIKGKIPDMPEGESIYK